jgi:hypothetical protein
LHPLKRPLTEKLSFWCDGIWAGSTKGHIGYGTMTHSGADEARFPVVHSPMSARNGSICGLPAIGTLLAVNVPRMRRMERLAVFETATAGESVQALLRITTEGSIPSDRVTAEVRRETST